MDNLYRIGTGYDAHRLQKGRKLFLGGVEIEYEAGLLGHSDADVLTHAIMDAILGALGVGDIGVIFPPSDKTYRNISSLKLLSETNQMIEKAQFSIVNIDSTIMAQEPPLNQHVPAMKRKLAATLGLETSQINIKATTTEGMGFIGRGEGIAAIAVVLLVGKR